MRIRTHHSCRSHLTRVKQSREFASPALPTRQLRLRCQGQGSTEVANLSVIGVESVVWTGFTPKVKGGK